MKNVCWSCDTFDEGRCEGCTTSCDKCSACLSEEFTIGTDQDLGKFDAEVIDGRGYYDENGSFCKFSDSF